MPILQRGDSSSGVPTIEDFGKKSLTGERGVQEDQDPVKMQELKKILDNDSPFTLKKGNTEVVLSSADFVNLLHQLKQQN